jgi:hypothetical protein
VKKYFIKNLFFFCIIKFIHNFATPKNVLLVQFVISF